MTQQLYVSKECARCRTDQRMLAEHRVCSKCEAAIRSHCYREFVSRGGTPARRRPPEAREDTKETKYGAE